MSGQRPGRVALWSVAFLTSALATMVAEAQTPADDFLRRHRPLRPDELLLVYNGNKPASHDLAVYYATARKVPTDRMCPVMVPGDAEKITRDRFERLIREPVRTYMETKHLRDKVRCVVTFYGVPIRVGKQVNTAEQDALLKRLRKKLISTLDEFEREIGETLSVMDGKPARLHPRMPEEEDYPKLLQRYASIRTAIWEHVRRKSANDKEADQRAKLIGRLQTIEGDAGFLFQVKPQSAVAQAHHRQLTQEVQRKQVRADMILKRGLKDPSRGEAYDLIRQSAGIISLLGILNHDILRLRTDQTEAAVDSELMLLWWDDYAKHRWLFNPLSWQVRSTPALRQRIPPRDWQRPVLMAARIDASTPKVARRMINQAIAAERNGVSGKVYLDARGLEKEDGSRVYDQDLRDLARLLKSETQLDVRFDNRPALFRRGECPDALLYCGWYSLRKYVDAFDFAPGAVGYHIASFEAISLKGRGERGWCKGLLDDGITATLGAVAEPYLQSFPPPKRFFGLLLTGRFTLAECFAYTANFNSWMQMLLGDPLYRPFARAPRLRLEQVFAPEDLPPASQPAGQIRPGP